MTEECKSSAEGWAQVSAHLRVTEGLGYVEEVDSFVAELVSSCTAGRSLREAIEMTLQKLGWTSSDVPIETAAIVRQLVEEGFLIPA